MPTGRLSGEDERAPCASSSSGEPVGEVSKANTTLLSYRDQVGGHKGWLAFHGMGQRLAVGGFRVHPAVTGPKIEALARVMATKEAILGLPIDGAKCGLACDPAVSDRRGVIRRFLRFLRPHLLDRFSMGPDMGTRWSELEELARSEGIPSVKIAIADAQELSEAEVVSRIRVLDERVGPLTLAERRAGHGLAHVGLAVTESLGLATDAVSVGVQGFGTLGRAAALALDEVGARVTVIADENTAIIAEHGLDVSALAAGSTGGRLPVCDQGGATTAHRGALFDHPVDLLVLAACEGAMSPRQAREVPPVCSVVAVGANLGLAPDVEELLSRRGIVVIPDIVGGCGGSASMDALFGPGEKPTPQEFLEGIKTRMWATGTRLLDVAEVEGISLRAAACRLRDDAVHAFASRSGTLRPYAPWDPGVRGGFRVPSRPLMRREG